jgi:predicted glycosyltransferase
METLDEEYGLVISTGEEGHAVARAKELATDPTAAARWGTRRDRLLAESVDVTGFMLDRIAEQATGHPHWERVAIDT